MSLKFEYQNHKMFIKFASCNKIFLVLTGCNDWPPLERGNFDDTKEAIEKRCANFQNQTRPVLAKYAAKLVKVLSLIVIMLSDCIYLLPSSSQGQGCRRYCIRGSSMKHHIEKKEQI